MNGVSRRVAGRAVESECGSRCQVEVLRAGEVVLVLYAVGGPAEW